MHHNFIHLVPRVIFHVTILSLFVTLPNTAFGKSEKIYTKEQPQHIQQGKVFEAIPTVENEQTTQDETIEIFLGSSSVTSFIAQPELPVALLPHGIPIVTPRRLPKRRAFAEQVSLTGTTPEVIKVKEPNRPPKLLPEPELEPGIVYVVPFTGVMVPDEVHERIFDQFVDMMNEQADILGLQFVILKQGLQGTTSGWLTVRKYITGEIYSYVEKSGCCSTDMRTKARITYHHPKQKTPLFDTTLPVSVFFDHDQSNIGVERLRLAESIATTLAKRLSAKFDTILISKQYRKSRDSGA